MPTDDMLDELMTPRRLATERASFAIGDGDFIDRNGYVAS